MKTGAATTPKPIDLAHLVSDNLRRRVHAAINGTRLRLTDGGAVEDSSAFSNTPVNIQSFTNDFSFQLTNAAADGFTFTVHLGRCRGDILHQGQLTRLTLYWTRG